MFEDPPTEQRNEPPKFQLPLIEAALAFAAIVFIARLPTVPMTIAQLALTAFGGFIAGVLFSAAWNTIVDLTVGGVGMFARVARTAVAILLTLIVSSMVLEAFPTIQVVVRPIVGGFFDAFGIGDAR